MPTYYYKCNECEEYTDVWLSPKEMDTFSCVGCGGAITWMIDKPPTIIGCDVEPMSSSQEESFYRRKNDKRGDS